MEKSLWYRYGQKQKADKGRKIHGVKIFHYKSHGCKSCSKSHEGALEHRNNLHWVFDTVFDEDYCRVRKDNIAQNLNIIRKLVEPVKSIRLAYRNKKEESYNRQQSDSLLKKGKISALRFAKSIMRLHCSLFEHL